MAPAAQKKYLGVILRVGVFAIVAMIGYIIFPIVMQFLGVNQFILAALSTFATAGVANAIALRIYEREGLLDPARSPGGTRRYSTNDIGRLHQIMALTADGLNLAGVRRVLELQEETRRMQAEIDRLKAAARTTSQEP